MVTMGPMSMPDQLLCLASMIPLPLKVTEGKNLSPISGMLSMKNMTSLTNTAMSAVGAVLNISGLSLSPSIPPSPAKGYPDSDNVVVVDDSGSMEDWDLRDDESDPETDSWESITDSSPE